MFTNRRLFISIIILVVFLSSCAQPTPLPTSMPVPTDLPTATFTPSPTFTLTPTPTKTPKPTATPNMTATQQYENFSAKINEYYDEGYISTTEGEYTRIKNFSVEWAQIDWYRWYNLNSSPTNFVIRTDILWDSASKAANDSGCGFVFRIQDNNDHYLAYASLKGFVSAAGILNKGWDDLGMGTYGNPSSSGKLNMVLIVQDNTFRMIIDDELVKTFTGYQGKLTEGKLAYTVLSGTNKDFGTRCKFTNTELWSLK
jgi:hypothetical protein